MVGGLAAVLPAVTAVAALALGGAAWEPRAPLPVPRTEVAAAPFRGDIAVVGGYLPDGSSSDDVDLYDPASDSWSRLPDLPVEVNHASAVSADGKLYVVGGYGGPGVRLRNAYVFDGDSWRGLRPLPAERAAAGAATVGRKLYVVGGVGPNGLARGAFALDLKTGRWASFGGPTPREHLAATAAGGKVYAVGGRLAGLDTNLRVFEAYSPTTHRWTKLAPVPESRGGTGAAFAKGLVVSVGGEAPGRTIGSVYGYDVARKRWRPLASLPTPRHGIGVATTAGRVYVIGGGTEPGLTVSGANEALTIP